VVQDSVNSKKQGRRKPGEATKKSSTCTSGLQIQLKKLRESTAHDRGLLSLLPGTEDEGEDPSLPAPTEAEEAEPVLATELTEGLE
jgi:hypothetical protein